MMNIGAGIIGTGLYLPEQLLTNQVLADQFGVTPDWIYDRTGIHNRRIVGPGQACSDLAVAAARQALAASGTNPEEIGMVIVATSTGVLPYAVYGSHCPGGVEDTCCSPVLTFQLPVPGLSMD